MRTKIQLLLILVVSILLLIKSSDINSLKQQVSENNQQMEYRTNYLHTETGILQGAVSSHTVRIVNLENKKQPLPRLDMLLKPSGG